VDEGERGVWEVGERSGAEDVGEEENEGKGRARSTRGGA
jgi:hypothetical protein